MCQQHYLSSNQIRPIKQLQKLGNALLQGDLHVATVFCKSSQGGYGDAEQRGGIGTGQPLLGPCVGWRAGQGGEGAAHQGVPLLADSTPLSKPG